MAIRPAYRPIQPQPRNALFRRKPEIQAAAEAHQKALASVSSDPKMIKMLQNAQMHDALLEAAKLAKQHPEFRIDGNLPALYAEIDEREGAPEATRAIHDAKDPRIQEVQETRGRIRQALEAEYTLLQEMQKQAGQIPPVDEEHILAIHKVLTENQRYTLAQNANRQFIIDMPRGAYKTTHTQLTLPNGLVMNHCPPGERTEQEMKRLLRMHGENLRAGTPPEIEAAWMMGQLQHIHPFQDANKRVSRTAGNQILARAMMPVIGFASRLESKTLETAMLVASHNQEWEHLIGTVEAKVLETLHANTQRIQRMASFPSRALIQLKAGRGKAMQQKISRNRPGRGEGR